MIFQRDPTLEELLREPIIQQVMKSDGVDAEDIRKLLRSVSRPDEGDGLARPTQPTAFPPANMAGCCLEAC